MLLAVARVEAGLRVVSWNIDRGSKLRGVISYAPSLEMWCNVQTKAQSQVGRSISLIRSRVRRRERNSAYGTSI